MDAAPGYYDSIFLEVPEEEPLELRVRMLKASPHATWKPTFFLDFDPAGDRASGVHYYLHVSEDTDLQKLYARMRLVDVGAKRELENITHQALFPLDHEFAIKAFVVGATVRIELDGQEIAREALPRAPLRIGVGVSSGTFEIIKVGLPPPPAL
jgi:hypothetical protein